jgi:hypothetical protein
MDWRQQFSSASFWIVALVTGLLFGIVANYLTRLIDRGFGFGIGAVRRRSELRKASERRRIEVLAANSGLRTVELHLGAMMREAGLLMVLVGTMSVNLALHGSGSAQKILGFAVGMLSLVAGSQAFMRGMNHSRFAMEAVWLSGESERSEKPPGEAAT